MAEIIFLKNWNHTKVLKLYNLIYLHKNSKQLHNAYFVSDYVLIT